MQAGRWGGGERGGRSRLDSAEVTKIPAQPRGTWVSAENWSWEGEIRTMSWPLTLNSFIQKKALEIEIVSNRHTHIRRSVSLFVCFFTLSFYSWHFDPENTNSTDKHNVNSDIVLSDSHGAGARSHLKTLQFPTPLCIKQWSLLITESSKSFVPLNRHEPNILPQNHSHMQKYLKYIIHNFKILRNYEIHNLRQLLRNYEIHNFKFWWFLVVMIASMDCMDRQVF